MLFLAIPGALAGGWTQPEGGHWSRELEQPYNMVGTGDTQYVGLGIGLGWWFNEHIGVATAVESVVFARANAAAPTIPLYLQVR